MVSENIICKYFLSILHIMVSMATNTNEQCAKNMADRRFFKEHFYNSIKVLSKYLQLLGIKCRFC